MNSGVSLQVTDGAARTCLGRDEPSLRAAVRHHRPRRVRTRPHPGQGPARPGAATARPRPVPAAAADHQRDWQKAPRCSRPASPVGTASAPPRRAPAPTPTSANTARTSAPTPASCPILAAQRADTAVLAADAEARGWAEEAARHHARSNALDAAHRPDPGRMTSRHDRPTTSPRRKGLRPTRRRRQTHHRRRRRRTSPASAGPPSTGVPSSAPLIEEHRQQAARRAHPHRPGRPDRPAPPAPRGRRRQRPPPRRTTPPPQPPTLTPGLRSTTRSS